MKTISLDLRERILAAYDADEGTREAVARRFRVSLGMVIRRARRAWRRQQASFDPARLVFLDESGAKTNLTRRCGRAQRGERVHASQPYGHWQTTTMLSSIRLDGSTACMTIEGATDTEVFQSYVREVLCPTLRPGDW